MNCHDPFGENLRFASLKNSLLKPLLTPSLPPPVMPEITLQDLAEKLDAISIQVQQLGALHSTEPYQLIDKKTAVQRTGLSAATLKAYRSQLDSPLIEGVHYVRINSRTIHYRSPLIEHWANHRHDPDACLQKTKEYMEHQKSGTRRSRVTPA
jgi:hypothetical protein